MPFSGREGLCADSPSINTVLLCASIGDSTHCWGRRVKDRVKVSLLALPPSSPTGRDGSSFCLCLARASTQLSDLRGELRQVACDRSANKYPRPRPTEREGVEICMAPRTATVVTWIQRARTVCAGYNRISRRAQASPGWKGVHENHRATACSADLRRLVLTSSQIPEINCCHCHDPGFRFWMIRALIDGYDEGSCRSCIEAAYVSPLTVTWTSPFVMQYKLVLLSTFPRFLAVFRFREAENPEACQ